MKVKHYAMKKYFILTLYSISIVSLSAQVDIQWQRTMGGSNFESPYVVIQSNDGGYVVAGYAYSSDGDVVGSHGFYDVWIIKFDAFGNVQWKKCYGGTDNEQANDIIQTSDGGYIIVGKTQSSDGDVFGSIGVSDIWVIKISGNGNIEWQKCLGGNVWDEGFKIIQMINGDFVIAGTTFSNDVYVNGNHGNNDIWIVRIDASGNVLWQKCIGGSDDDGVHSMIKTQDNGFVVVGYTNSNDGDVSGLHDWYDCWIVKLDSIANIQWQKCIGGSGWDEAFSIIQTANQNFIFSGYTTDFNMVGYHDQSDVLVVYMDLSGNLIWQKCYGGSYNDKGNSIIQTPNGEYIIAGESESIDGDVTPAYSASECWIMSIDSVGALKWQKCFGGDGLEWVTSISYTSDGGYIYTGITDSQNGDVIGLHGSLWDYWVVKLMRLNVSGIVYNDINENAFLDSGEQGAAGQMVKLEPGPLYSFTDNNGNYYFQADTGIASITYVPYPYWYPTGINPYDVHIDSISHTIDTLDIGIKCRINIQDASVYITGSPTRIDSEIHYWLTYKNWGTVTANGTIEFQYDPILAYNTSTLVPVSHVGNTLTFAYDTLGPGAQRNIRVDFQVPGVQNLGDTLHSFAMITPLVPDTFITNNYDTIQRVITGSYDPNCKSVSPAGYEQWGFVEHGQRLSYTIQFQNTGTDTAFNVVIRDTLDADLDIETFVVEAYSHPVTWQLHNGNELFLTFQNIMLPDSNVNEPESNGFIRYSISPKQGLTDGTTATNTSYIFFDYNPAVITNSTLNTFVTNIPVAIPILESLKSEVFPNPSTDYIYINLPEYTSKLDIYSLNGAFIEQIMPKNEVAKINISDLPTGLYIVKIYSNHGIITSKFIKE